MHFKSAAQNTTINLWPSGEKDGENKLNSGSGTDVSIYSFDTFLLSLSFSMLLLFSSGTDKVPSYLTQS